MSKNIHLYDNGAAWLLPLPPKDICAALTVMRDAAGADMPIDLYILRDGAMARENLRCMGCAGPTNILSFSDSGDIPATLLLSIDTARRECLLYGQDATEYVLRLLAHGLAHILGLDHGPEMDALCARLETAARNYPAPILLGDVTSALDSAREHTLPEWGSVLAHSQSAGRGQLRRNWYSPPGNLYGALRLPAKAPFMDTDAAPALGGMVVDVLYTLFPTLDIRLKWPNDIVLIHDGKPYKWGGILLEERGGILIAGIGLNIVSAPPVTDLREECALPAISLAEITGEKADVASIWRRLVHGLFFCYTHTVRVSGWQALVEKYLLWRTSAVMPKDTIYGALHSAGEAEI